MRRKVFLFPIHPPFGGRRFAAFAGMLVLLFFAVLLPSFLYFRRVSGVMALSEASDYITSVINEVVLEHMSSAELRDRGFVSLERDTQGRVTAIVTDMARVNALSAELLNEVVSASEQENVELFIPVGDLLGSNFLLGRGPDIPVRVTMLTSSSAGFQNELVDAGINQTKHQLILELCVDIDVLLPWEMMSTQVRHRVLIAETIIVGTVPDTYLNWGTTYGRTEGNPPAA